MKADPNITGISLRRALLGNPTPRANYILMTATNGIPAAPDPAKRDELYMGAVGTNYAGYVAKITAMSEVVGRTLSRIAVSMENLVAAEGDVVVAYRLKVAQGKAAELRSLMRTYRLPLAAEGVKSGDRRAGPFPRSRSAGEARFLIMRPRPGSSRTWMRRLDPMRLPPTGRCSSSPSCFRIRATPDIRPRGVSW